MRALLLLIGLFLIFTPQSLKAEENKQQPVRIEIDQDAGHFTFIIDNEPAARLDKDGLHVLGDVTYGGLLIDKNEAVRETLAGKAKSTEMKEE
jgi:hypothetical protein